MNDNVGYCQTHRSIITMLKKYGSMKAIAEKAETDCSNLVRGCIYEATGKDAGKFNTSTEPTALEKTGLFEKKVAVTASTQFKPGDILVTKTKGHIQKIWETGTEIDRANISNSYKAIKGNFNTNSMTLYSGTKVQSLRQSIVDTNYYRCCCNRNRKNAGCLYMGDYDVSGKYKSGFD